MSVKPFAWLCVAVLSLTPFAVRADTVLDLPLSTWHETVTQEGANAVFDVTTVGHLDPNNGRYFRFIVGGDIVLLSTDGPETLPGFDLQPFTHEFETYVTHFDGQAYDYQLDHYKITVPLADLGLSSLPTPYIYELYDTSLSSSPVEQHAGPVTPLPRTASVGTLLIGVCGASLLLKRRPSPQVA